MEDIGGGGLWHASCRTCLRSGDLLSRVCCDEEYVKLLLSCSMRLYREHVHWHAEHQSRCTSVSHT